MMNTSTVEHTEKAPVQQHFEALINDCVAIEIIINDPLFRIVMNPTFKAKSNAAAQIKGFVRDGSEQASADQEDPAIAYALHIRDLITRLILQYKLRYSGNNSHGGPTGRVQMFLNGKWIVVKGLTHRNFPIPTIRQRAAEETTRAQADNEVKSH